MAEQYVINTNYFIILNNLRTFAYKLYCYVSIVSSLLTVLCVLLLVTLLSRLTESGDLLLSFLLSLVHSLDWLKYERRELGESLSHDVPLLAESRAPLLTVETSRRLG